MDEHRLMPKILHLEASHNPQRIFAIVANSNDICDGFREVTFQQVARAVNWVANWLEARLEGGTKPSRHETLTYIGVPDLRYNILFCAAIQCRYKVFLPSPRNTTDVNVSLLQQTQCLKLVHSVEVWPVAQILQAALPGLRCEQFPSLDDLLAVSVKEYAYDLRYSDVYQEPILVLHSSGSTGLPNPVVYTHGTFATYDVRDWPTVPGRVNHDALSTLRFSEPGSRVYDVFPPFHVVGILTKIMLPLYNLTVPIFGPPLRPPSGALAADMMRLHHPRGAVIPPSIVEQLYHEPGGLQLLGQLDVLLYAGGPLPKVIGDELTGRTTLCQFYGSTEMGQIRQLIPLPEDWAYFTFHPHERFELQLVDENAYELVVFADKDLERTSSLYHNFPEVREWRTKDLFKPHPTKPDLWQFYARRDDILVFSSGEKLNPIPMESSITAVPSISGALVTGQGRAQASLLLELSQDAAFPSDPRDALWPHIEEANALLPGHGRIAKSMVLFADSKKPFVRAGKGTVVRRLTENLYAVEIEKMYESSGRLSVQNSSTTTAPIVHKGEVTSLVRSLLAQLSVDHQLGDEENFYFHGMDSIKTMEAVGYLKDRLRQSKSESDINQISAEILYLNPTIKQLSSVLLAFLEHGILPRARNRVADMQAKIAKYVAYLPQTIPESSSRTDSLEYTVAITGTTGFLGGWILTELAKNLHISSIYCLNRSTRAREIFEGKNPKNSANVVFLQANLSAPNLGLSKEKYNRLLQDCDIVIHNAWRVDFNLSLDSFEDNLQSVNQLIHFCAASSRQSRVIFISSIASTGVSGLQGSPQQTIPEAIVEDLGMTMDTGYAESKCVAEHILHAASKKGLPATIIRTGQLAPSSLVEAEDSWPPNDLVSSFLRTCRASEKIASDFVDAVDWIPIDKAAGILGEVIQSHVSDARATRLLVYNLVQPQPLPWMALMQPVLKWCGEATQTVSLKQWVSSLDEYRQSDSKTLDRLPALRMLAVFDQMAKQGAAHQYATQKIMAVSETMRQLAPVDIQKMSIWLERL